MRRRAGLVQALAARPDIHLVVLGGTRGGRKMIQLQVERRRCASGSICSAMCR